MNQEIAINQNHTAQHQIARALAEMFEGKTFRYLRKGRETWFVAKDMVEAAGGAWHAPNFKSTVGEGGYTITPLEINGISQNVMISPHKSIIKWLAVSRLPKAEQFSDLVWNILDKVFKGESINVSNTKNIDQKAIELIKSWETAIALANDGKKWGVRFIKFLEECGMDRDRYIRMINNFFSSFHGDYEFKKEIIHKMRRNFQNYKKDALTNCKYKDISMMNVILLDVERELENLWARYEAHSRGQLQREKYNFKLIVEQPKQSQIETDKNWVF